MEQKKTMKLWQMLVLLILPACLLITMFLPAYHIDGKAAKKICSEMTSNEEIPELAKAIIGSIDTDKIQEKADEKIANLEEDYEIKLTNITPARIMTHNFKTFFGELGEKDSFSDMESVYTKQRILLWVIYLLAVIVILMLAAGYFLKWVKYVSLSVSAVYGAAAAVVFGIFQFAAPRFLTKIVNVKDILGLGVLVTNLLDYVLDQFLDSSVAKVMSCFWGFAFLAAFVIGILTVIVSVAFMLIGNGKERSNEDEGLTGELWEDESDELENNVWTPEGSLKKARENESGGQAGTASSKNMSQNADEIFVEGKTMLKHMYEPQPEIRQNAAASATVQNANPAASPMGKVLCTKGVAMGQGFSLPEDRKVVVGKNGRNANLIIGDPAVSSVHCSIRYRAAANSYIVKDHSTNGTFVNGVRLKKDTGVELSAGTVLQLADGRNEITLG